ncbi:MAG: lipid-A-disaccharide synthase [Deltaproteobacteria bacterium]|nr:lipid-A-disaccharide synthase [Deltaproteobacteria bacterium]
MIKNLTTDHRPLTTILIVAGEASGDAHAARLVAALRERLPAARFLGIGGEALAEQGVGLLVHASELAVVGLLEVAGRLPAVGRALAALHRAFKKERPALVILVDFPDFNFWVARLAKWHGVPVMYYISPQVWAWRSYRVRTIARLVDRMAVIFPFEAEFYRRRGVPVDFVGHPFQETLPDLPPRKELLRGWGLDPRRLTLALLPGSRAGEIERHLPTMLAGAELIQKALPEVQYILPLASTASFAGVAALAEEAGFRAVPEDKFCPGGTPAPPGTFSTLSIDPTKSHPNEAKEEPGSSPPSSRPVVQASRVCPAEKIHNAIRIIPGQAYAALFAADLAVVASGTATVEAALAGCPAIIVYRLSPLTFALGKRLIRVDYIGMANLLAQEPLFPELIQNDFTPARLAREALDLIRTPARLKVMRQGLSRVVTRLGGPGASARAAEVALRVMQGRK